MEQHQAGAHPKVLSVTFKSSMFFVQHDNSRDPLRALEPMRVRSIIVETGWPKEQPYRGRAVGWASVFPHFHATSNCHRMTHFPDLSSWCIWKGALWRSCVSFLLTGHYGACRVSFVSTSCATNYGSSQPQGPGKLSTILPEIRVDNAEFSCLHLTR